MKANNVSDITVKKSYWISFLKFSAIFLVFAFPIIWGHAFYADDFAHTLHEPKSWLHDHRPFAYLLELVLGPLSVIDISPLFQVLGIFVLCGSITFLYETWKNQIHIPLISLSFIVCQPFFIENLSYRYDSFFMCVSMSLALCPFFMERIYGRGSLKLYLAEYFFVFLFLNTYQPAINFYFSICLFEAIILLVKGTYLRSIAMQLGKRVFIAILSVATFVCETHLFFKKSHEYVAEHSELIRNISKILENIRTVFHLIREYFSNFYGVLTLLIILLGVVSCSLIFSREKKAFFKKTIVLLGLCAGLLLTFPGVQLLLNFPTFNPRTFLSFGTILAVGSFLSMERGLPKVFRCVNMALVGYVLIQNISLSASYENALAAQNHYREYMASQMVEDISHLRSQYNDSVVGHGGQQQWFWGTLGREPEAPLSHRILVAEPILRDIVNETLQFSLYVPSPWIMHDILLAQGLPEDVNTFVDLFGDEGKNYQGTPLWKGIIHDVDTCHVDEVITHNLYNTYKVGHYIISDYQKHCTTRNM
ncbi:hypothetical protein GS501_08355 [Saccharibacter sp. 17.LH.SD]|nr:glucosyltransferase domain-containing protein [Saccharibacter sp. 17.LH.SD]MXV45050.1 hypothetical protein [Saccharibacter sp. 17.LH.SD]